jgi:PiT family inorganic phosphate transporter
LFYLVIVLAVGFAIVNGAHDAANAIATVIGTRVLSPAKAIAMAAILNFAGAATGLAVAKTIGKGIIDPQLLDPNVMLDVMLAALVAAIIWEYITLHIGLPVSGHHCLIAGLVGAGIAAAGSETIAWGTFERVLASVAIAPALGFTVGLFLMVAIMWVFRRTSTLRVEGIFSRLQILSAAFMAYSHGKNDGQMPIGIIVMALSIHTGVDRFEDVPFWIIALCAAAIALGTALGGWRVIRTLGVRITAMRPVQGFAAESAAASVIEAASAFGIPVSTTHCISSSIMGVGATRRLSAVRWGVAGNIVLAWILTFPICGIIGYVIFEIANLV